LLWLKKIASGGYAADPIYWSNTVYNVIKNNSK